VFPKSAATQGLTHKERNESTSSCSHVLTVRRKLSPCMMQLSTSLACLHVKASADPSQRIQKSAMFEQPQPLACNTKPHPSTLQPQTYLFIHLTHLCTHSPKSSIIAATIRSHSTQPTPPQGERLLRVGVSIIDYFPETLCDPIDCAQVSLVHPIRSQAGCAQE
jgi:hypothetical protein